MNIGCYLCNFIKNNRRQDVIQRAADAQMEHAFTAQRFKTGAWQFVLDQLQRLAYRAKQLIGARRRLNTAAIAHKKLVIKHHFQS